MNWKTSLSLITLLAVCTACGSDSSDSTRRGVAVNLANTNAMVSPTASGVSASPTNGVLANGTDFSVITVSVIGDNGFGLFGRTVQLNSNGGTLGSSTGTTDFSGVFQTTLRSNSAGTFTVSAIVDPGPNQVAITQTAMVTFVPPPTPDAGQSTVTANPTMNLNANGMDSSSIVVTVNTAAGVPIPGLQVALSSSGGGTTFTPAMGTTDANGQITSSLVSTQGGSKTVTATVDPNGSPVVISQMPSVTFVTPANVINGTANGETLNGTAGVDEINGLGGDDTLNGLAGDDRLNGGDGNDTLEGGPGADLHNGGAGTDTVTYANSGSGVTVNFNTNTGSGGDAQGDSFQDVENLTGSPNDDSLTGNDMDNVIIGGAGNDQLFGLDGADTLIGGAGADVLAGGANPAGMPDVVDYSGSPAGVTVNLAGSGSGGDAQGDTYSGIEGVIGTAMADNITGDGNDNIITSGAGNDTINGGGGDDMIDAGAGGDTIDGGAGTDTLTYENSSAAIDINLTNGTFAGGDAAGDSVMNVENVTGTSMGDTIVMEGTDNIIIGGDGNDILLGVGGMDMFMGGAGIDQVFYDSSNYQMIDGGDGTDLVLTFISTDFTDATTRMKFANIEDILITSNAQTISINSTDLLTITQPVNNGMQRQIIIAENSNTPNTGSTVVGTGWTFLNTQTLGRPYGSVTLNVYLDQSQNPVHVLGVESTLTQNITP